MRMRFEDGISCEVCGTKGRTITVKGDSDGMTAICEFCQGLINAGLIRAETLAGRRVYRYWEVSWSPGELVGPSKLEAA